MVWLKIIKIVLLVASVILLIITMYLANNSRKQKIQLEELQIYIKQLQEKLDNCSQLNDEYRKQLSDIQAQMAKDIQQYQIRLNAFARKYAQTSKEVIELKQYIVKHTNNECEDLKNALDNISNMHFGN